jgi:hypothetical protein
VIPERIIFVSRGITVLARIFLASQKISAFFVET